MYRRLLILIAPLVLLATPALASEEKKPKTDVGQYVDLQPVAMPIVVDGRLINYVFVYVRLNLTTSANVNKLRGKEPYFRDALVRSGHRTPFVLATDYQQIDLPRLTAAMMRDATALVGPGQIKSVAVTSQTPQKRIPPPRAGTSTRS